MITSGFFYVATRPINTFAPFQPKGHFAIYTMQDYVINVSQIEELQTLNDRNALDNIFEKAQRVVVGGGSVILVRQNSNGQRDKFDSFSTEGDLATYKNNVYKYLAD